MAKVTLSAPIESIRGKLGKDSGLCFMVRGGNTYMYRRMPGKMPKRIPVREEQSNAMQQRQALFKQAQAITQEIMRGTAQKALYEATWKKQKRYVTLRGYVFAQIYANLTKNRL